MKFVFPGILILVGFVLVGVAMSTGQNMAFLLAALAVVLTGIMTLLGTLGMLKKTMGLVVLIVCVLISLGLAWSNYRSIKGPLEFQAETDYRYAFVIQRLKEIRKAQIAYKSMHGDYSADFDKLLSFVKNDSFLVVKAEGQLHDTLYGKMSEDSAVLLGYITRDTTLMSVSDSIFSKSYMKERAAYFKKAINKSNVPFYIDSLAYVPFTGGAKFNLEAAEIEKNSVMVDVFECTDSKPYNKRHVLKVGSMLDPSTSGNWAE